MIETDIKLLKEYIEKCKAKDAEMVKRLNEGIYTELKGMTAHELWGIYNSMSKDGAEGSDASMVMLNIYKKRKLKEDYPEACEVVEKMLAAGLKIPSAKELVRQVGGHFLPSEAEEVLHQYKMEEE